MPYKFETRQQEAKHEWYLRNKELTRKRARAWKRRNKEKIREGAKRYSKNNADAIRKRQRDWENKQTAKLTDYYIIQELDKLGIPTRISRRMPLLIECVRQHYKMIRLQRKIASDGKSKIQEGK